MATSGMLGALRRRRERGRLDARPSAFPNVAFLDANRSPVVARDGPHPNGARNPALLLRCQRTRPAPSRDPFAR
jgi:hypothetical protein